MFEIGENIERTRWNSFQSLHGAGMLCAPTKLSQKTYHIEHQEQSLEVYCLSSGAKLGLDKSLIWTHLNKVYKEDLKWSSWFQLTELHSRKKKSQKYLTQKNPTISVKLKMFNIHEKITRYVNISSDH